MTDTRVTQIVIESAEVPDVVSTSVTQIVIEAAYTPTGTPATPTDYLYWGVLVQAPTA